MPNLLDPAHVSAKNLLRNTFPWVWLLEVRASDTEAFRLAAHDQEVIVPSNPNVEPATYDPFPVKLGLQEQNSDGVLSTLQLEVSNLTREVVRRCEAGELLDEIVFASLVNVNALTVGAAYQTRYRIIDVSANLTLAKFTLGQFNLFNSPFPAQTFRRTKCRYVYGDNQCGYDTTRAGALTTCDLTLNGANGCVVHGNDEAAAGLPVLHPLRYGAHPNIPFGSSRS